MSLPSWLLSRFDPWIFTRLDARAAVDILSVALIFFWVLWVIQGTRATQLIRGLAILVIGVGVVANILDLTALKWLLTKTLPALVVAVPIVFQPELRRALEQLGHTGAWLRPAFSADSASELERTVEEISRATAQLARLRYGALIVIERETGLQEYIDRGVPLDATLTRQLLINIFYPNSPLHDGAAIIRFDRILAAGCVLPLSDNVATGGQLGTRHRAGMGITEVSDAVAVIVSEETGQISVANNGRLYRNLDPERLRRVLRTLLRLDRPERPPVRPVEPRHGNGHGDGLERTVEDAAATPTHLD
ncbi:MAG TPA: diadenylate cyclase CdaA [Thermomicrobiaceae bacterium]|nr:diadenylate cyclase CdaA [Thermomicrobiaceae bacterium]